MNKTFKYRFKTFEEFKEEFGYDWRRVRGGFVENMDNLLGTDVDYQCYKHLLNDKGFLISDSKFSVMNIDRHSFQNRSYHVTNEMLVRVDIRPQYKRRRFIYE